MSLHWVTVRNEEFHLSLTASYKLYNIRLHQHAIGQLLKTDLFLIMEDALKEQSYSLLLEWWHWYIDMIVDFKVNSEWILVASEHRHILKSSMLV
jgi:hypothetical protein